MPSSRTSSRPGSSSVIVTSLGAMLVVVAVTCIGLGTFSDSQTPTDSPEGAADPPSVNEGPISVNTSQAATQAQLSQVDKDAQERAAEERAAADAKAEKARAVADAKAANRRATAVMRENEGLRQQVTAAKESSNTFALMAGVAVVMMIVLVLFLSSGKKCNQEPLAIRDNNVPALEGPVPEPVPDKRDREWDQNERLDRTTWGWVTMATKLRERIKTIQHLKDESDELKRATQYLQRTQMEAKELAHKTQIEEMELAHKTQIEEMELAHKTQMEANARDLQTQMEANARDLQTQMEANARDLQTLRDEMELEHNTRTGALEAKELRLEKWAQELKLDNAKLNTWIAAGFNR